MNYSVLIPYLVGVVCSSLASNMLSVAIGWHLYQLTGDPLDLALVGLVQVIPALSLFLVTGWVVDNFRRKVILTSCIAIDAVVMACLALVMTGGEIQKEWIFALLFCSSFARAFVAPANQAILPNIVEEAFLSKAVAINSTTWNVASTAGPFLGGILLVVFDLQIYWVLSALCIISFSAYYFLPKLKQKSPSGRGLDQILGGIRFIKRSPIVLGSISLDLFIVIAGSVMTLLPIYAEDILNVGAFELGLMRSMPALGAVMVGLLIAKRSELNNVGRLLFISLVIFCASIILFGVSKLLWLSLLALWLYGASDMWQSERG